MPCVVDGLGWFIKGRARPPHLLSGINPGNKPPPLKAALSLAWQLRCLGLYMIAGLWCEVYWMMPDVLVRTKPATAQATSAMSRNGCFNMNFSLRTNILCQANPCRSKNTIRAATAVKLTANCTHEALSAESDCSLVTGFESSVACSLAP